MEGLKVIEQSIKPEVYTAAIMHAALNIPSDLKNGILATMSTRRQMMTQGQFNEFINQVKALIAELQTVVMNSENSYYIVKDVLAVMRELYFPLVSPNISRPMREIKSGARLNGSDKNTQAQRFLA